MTKEEILNGMSEAEFYRLYPTKESWEAAQAEMAYGGSPYNTGIPFGAGITMAHGGTPYYGGPLQPFGLGGLPKAGFGKTNPPTGIPEIGANVKGATTNVDLTAPVKWNQDPGQIPKGANTGGYNAFQSWLQKQQYEGQPFVNNPSLNTPEGRKKMTEWALNEFNTKSDYVKQFPKNKVTPESIKAIQEYHKKSDPNVQVDSWVGSQTSRMRYPTPSVMYEHAGDESNKTPLSTEGLMPVTYGNKQYVVPASKFAGGKQPLISDYVPYDPAQHYEQLQKPKTSQEYSQYYKTFQPPAQQVASNKYGGTPYYGGPIYPAAYGGDIAEYCWGGLPGGPNEMPAMEDGGFYVGGNYNSPTNYGSFSVPMNQGGYNEFGGAYDTTNAGTYPMMNTGGYGFIDDAISSVNATRKSGGDITSQGGNQDFLSQRNNYFLNYMQKMIDKNIRQEEAAKVKDAFIEMDSQLPPIGSTMAYGGVYQIGGPGISYRQSFDTVNPQNEAMIQAYQNMANTQQGNINKAWGNLYNSFYENGGGPNKDESWEDYQKRLAEEKAGKEGGRGRVWDGTKWVPVNKSTDKNITYETTSPWANLAYGLNPEGQISKWIPDNDIRVGYRLGKKDFAEMAGLDPNIHKLSGVQFNYGPMGKLMPRVFGPKSITFGTMDMSKGAFEHLKEPLSFNNQTPGATRSYDDMNWFQKMKEDRRVAGQEKDAEKRRQRIAEIGPEAYKEEQAWNDMSWREKRASNKAMKQNLREDELRDKRLQELQNATGPVVKAYGGLPIAQTAPNPISYDDWAESLKFNPPSVAEEGPDEQFPPVETVGTKEQTEQEALADVAGIQKRRAEQEAMFGPAMGSKPDIMGGPGKQFTAKKKTTGVGKALAKRAHLVADIISSGLEAAQSNAKQKMQDMTLADNRFMTMSSSAKNRGDYDPNSGMFRPNQMVPVQFPGYTAQWGGFNTMEFGGLPMALSGLEVKMQPGLYGTNGNSQFNKSSHLEAGKISQKPTEVRSTLLPVARAGANLEAEKGETAVVNIDGMPAHFKIGGKRHSQGGTPLNLPDNSFIFSDTFKMKIKDPNVLAQFGMAPKKGGYTPAEIAKKYDINKFRKILADPNTEDLERKTAEMMIANYNEKLAKLALAQESIKGFPQGIPVIAMPYIDAMQMDPSTFLPAQAEEQMEGEDQPDAETGEARYGANVISQFLTKRYGGLPYAQAGISSLQAAQQQFNPAWMQTPSITAGTTSAGQPTMMAAPTMGLKTPKMDERGMPATEEAPEVGLANYVMETLAFPQKAMMYGVTGIGGDRNYQMINPQTGQLEWVDEDIKALKEKQGWVPTGETKKAFYETPGETIARSYPESSPYLQGAATLLLDPALGYGVAKAATRVGRLPMSTMLANEAYKNVKKVIKGAKAAPGTAAEKAGEQALEKSAGYLSEAKVNNILRETHGSKKLAKMSNKQLLREKALVHDGYKEAVQKTTVLLEKQPKYLKKATEAKLRIATHTNKAVSKQAMRNAALTPGEKITQAAEWTKEKVIDPAVKAVKKVIPDIEEKLYQAQRYSHAATPLTQSAVKNILQARDQSKQGPAIIKAPVTGKDGLPLYMHRDYPGQFFKMENDSIKPYNPQLGLYGPVTGIKAEPTTDTLSVLKPAKADTTKVAPADTTDWENVDWSKYENK